MIMTQKGWTPWVRALNRLAALALAARRCLTAACSGSKAPRVPRGRRLAAPAAAGAASAGWPARHRWQRSRSGGDAAGPRLTERSPASTTAAGSAVTSASGEAPAAGGKKILLVVGNENGTSMRGEGIGDKYLRARLEMQGHTVTIGGDNTASRAICRWPPPSPTW